MYPFIFKIFNKSAIIFILACYLISNVSCQTYCSSYCSYFNLGTTYAPMCTGPSSAQCTKCDQNLFQLVNTSCVPHKLFNESLEIQDLFSPMGTTLGYWQNKSNYFRVNTQLTNYQLMEFYYDTSPAGGDDTVYRTFINLPPHYSVRLRFFVLRSLGASVNFHYYIDNKKFKYDYSQYPSSQTLGDIVTTDKIFHQDTNLTIAFEALFAGVSNQFIGVKELLIFISKCPQNCLLCDSSSNCVKCATIGNGTKTYLYQGYCYLDCPQTHFQNNTLQTCEKCQAQCQNCDVNSSYCTQCISQGKYETFLYNNTCHYNCPDGYFKNYDTNICDCPINGYFVNSNHKCELCATQCNSCFGPLRTQCYNCSIGYYLINGTYSCSSYCPAGTYGDQLARLCVACSSMCSQCQLRPNKCTACYLKFTVRYLYDQDCLTQCPRGYGKNYLNRKCQICPPYYYSYNGSCVMQCPELYVANNETKACLYITQTNFTLTPKISAISLNTNGKSLIFQLQFTQGLSQSSKNWIYSQAYYNVSLQRNGIKTYPTSVSPQNNYIINLLFSVNQQLADDTQLLIDFGKQLNTTSNFNYAKTSLKFKISDYPKFLAEYYSKGARYYFKISLIPIFLILTVLIGLRFKGSYDMLIESVRLYQYIGLSVFLIYPMQSQIYSLVQGLNYFNFQFLPNIYNQFVPPFDNSIQNDIFSGFKFMYGDMDFIRMIGSILILIAALIIIIVVIRYLIKKNTDLLGWLIRLGMDLVQIKIMHSFWNSLIFTLTNSNKQNLYIMWVHIFSYVFMGLVGFRYYKIYESNQIINYSFIWRLISTLFISIAIFNKMVLLLLITLISVGFGFKSYYSTRQRNQQLAKFKFGFVFSLRDIVISLLPWLSVMAVSMIVFYRNQMNSISVIATLTVFIYILTVLQVIIVILLKYFYNRIQSSKSNNQNKPRQDGNDNKMEKFNTISNTSQSNLNDNQSFIKDQFAGDFSNAHRKTLADNQQDMRDNDSKMRYTLQRTYMNSSCTKIEQTSRKSQYKEKNIKKQQIKNQSNKTQENKEIIYQGKDTKRSEKQKMSDHQIKGQGQDFNRLNKLLKNRKLYPKEEYLNQKIDQHQDQQKSQADDKLRKANRIQNRTQVLQRRVQPLRTLQTKRQQDTQFQHITLKKVQQDRMKQRNSGMSISQLVNRSKTTIVNVKQNQSSSQLQTRNSKKEQNRVQNKSIQKNNKRKQTKSQQKYQKRNSQLQILQKTQTNKPQQVAPNIFVNQDQY